MTFELLIIILLFIFSFVLIAKDFRFSLIVLLGLSVLLHKELFSIYRWDLLPVRLFMLALLGHFVFNVSHWLIKPANLRSLKPFLRANYLTPFVIFLVLLWVVRGLSIFSSKNIPSSILLYGFFTTIVALGLILYTKLRDNSEEIFKYIKIYTFIVFLLCLFGYFQFFLYQKYEIIIGALWNIPNNLPRIGTTFWDVNHFGALLSSLLPVLGVSILTVKSWRERAFNLFMFIPMVGILLLTNSRTAWMIAFTAFLVFITVNLIRRFKFKGIMLLIGAIIMITIPLVHEYSIKSSPFRAKIKQYFHYRIDSYDSHFLLLSGAIEVFETYPYFGGGYGGFFEQFSRTKVASEYFSRDPAALNTRVPAHTIWGELVAETGIFGLSAFILFIGLNLLVLLYLAMLDTRKEVFLRSAAMFSAITGILVAGIFYSYNSEFFWLVIFLYSLYGLSQIKVTLTQVLSYFASSSKVTFTILAVIAGVLIFTQLGTNHLIPWDEAIYAKVAKNMVVNNNFITEFWWPGRVWYEKPPFYMWLMAILMKVLGYGSLAPRLPSAIFGFGTVLLVYFWGKRVFNKTAAFISAFALLTTFHFLYYTRAAMLDVTSTFFVTLALYLYWLGVTNPKKKYFFVAGLSVGFAILTKGVIGLLPFGVITFYEIFLLLTKTSTNLKYRFKLLLLMFLTSAAVFLPWHIEMYREFGNMFLTNYIGYHVLDRATTAIEDKGRPVWWYLEVIKVSMRLWFIVLLGALPFSMYQAKKKSIPNRFLLVASIFILAFFSFSKSKLVWYIIPIYPFLALMVGNFSERFLNFVMEKNKRFNNVLFKSSVLFGMVSLVLMYLFLNRSLVYTYDATKSQALLLQRKDTEFGNEKMLYVDKVETPLVLYYTDGPFEGVDPEFLIQNFKFYMYNQDAVMLTKESRYRRMHEVYPQITLVEAQNEWVLSYFPSQYDIDRKSLKEIQEDLNETGQQYINFVNNGQAVPSEILTRYNDLQIQLFNQQQKIEAGLKTLPSQ